jgi:hypothetical protein
LPQIMNEYIWLGLSRESDAPTNPVRVSESADTTTCQRTVIDARSQNAGSVCYLRHSLFSRHDSETGEIDSRDGCTGLCSGRVEAQVPNCTCSLPNAVPIAAVFK